MTTTPGPCVLGQITPGAVVRGNQRIRATCSCRKTLTAWDVGDMLTVWARHRAILRPPADVIARTPTKADVAMWPHYYIDGPGNAIASRTMCPHAYYLTDSCPGCDDDADNLGAHDYPPS